MPHLTPGTYPAYTAAYIQLVEAETVAEAIDTYSAEMVNFFKNLPPEKTEHRYAPGKWNCKEIVQHLIDAERIFAFRALSLARGDSKPLPGFDENSYAAASDANERKWPGLLTELEVVRKSTDLLFKSFNAHQLEQSGITNNQPNSVKAIGFITIGHMLHHIKIIKERYL